jgi:uncharacterized protein
MKGVNALDIRDDPAGCVLAVKVVPGSSRSRVAGVLGDRLKVAVAAPPEKGRANAAVAQVLAAALGVDPRRITLAAGLTSPRKEFHVAGLSAQAVRQALADL